MLLLLLLVQWVKLLGVGGRQRAEAAVEALLWLRRRRPRLLLLLAEHEAHLGIGRVAAAAVGSVQ